MKSETAKNIYKSLLVTLAISLFVLTVAWRRAL